MQWGWGEDGHGVVLQVWGWGSTEALVGALQKW